jgi:arginyl-tRNA synthetase
MRVLTLLIKGSGSDFDKTYYESDTYLLGKDIVRQGLDKKVFFQKKMAVPGLT